MNTNRASLPTRRNFLKKGLAAGFSLGSFAVSSNGLAQEKRSKKIAALLVTGGGYHDYTAQKKILTEGVGAIIPVDWTIWQHDKADDLKAALSVREWAKPYDLIVYNFCHANEDDEEFINSLVNVHKLGKPMIAIHCALHSYHWRVGGGKKSKQDKEWNKLLGVVSHKHGPVGPSITVKQTDNKHSCYKPAKQQWNTPKGELYSIAKVYPSATVLAAGNSGRGEQPVVWINQYERAKVFATSMGHHNETVQSPEFLNLIAGGMVWATDEKVT